MKIDITHILKKVGTEMKLSQEEASHMDDVVKGYMAMKPRAAQVQTPRPNAFMYIFMQRGYVAAGLVVAIAFSGTISYAAEGALPGDILYGIKVGVNEKIAVTLTKAPEARAALEARLAGKRLDEAARLAVEDKLTPEHEAMLSQSFAVHAENATQETEKLHTDDESAAINAASSFESELESHESILVSIEKKGEASQLTRVVREKVARVARFRVDAEGRAFASVTPVAEAGATTMMMKVVSEPVATETVSDTKGSADGSRTVAKKMGDAAKKSLSNAKKQFSEHERLFEEPVRASVSEKIKAATLTIDAGDVSLAAESYKEAFTSYQSAFATTQSLLVYMKTSVAIRPQKLPETRFRRDDVRRDFQNENTINTSPSESQKQEAGKDSVETNTSVQEGTDDSTLKGTSDDSSESDDSRSGKSEDRIKLLNGVEIHL